MYVRCAVYRSGAMPKDDPRVSTQRDCRRQGRRAAMTLVEILVVISIIGMLMALLLPAVQASRESARQNICENHLKQLGLAMQNHESATRRFPSGGWGYTWAGDPDRGSGTSQPGGWAYDVLPYLERRDLRIFGAGLPLAEKQAAIGQILQVPLPVFYCPSRRSVRLEASDPLLKATNYRKPSAVAESDYAVNAGDSPIGIGPGPKSYAQGDDPNYEWTDTSKCTGICFLRSQVGMADIRDGSSRTYLIGEKYAVMGGWDPGDDQGVYAGFDYDTVRFTNGVLTPDQSQKFIERFGSSHPTGGHFVFCDGSVRAISFDINPRIHRFLGNRRDMVAIDDAMIK